MIPPSSDRTHLTPPSRKPPGNRPLSNESHASVSDSMSDSMKQVSEEGDPASSPMPLSSSQSTPEASRSGVGHLVNSSYSYENHASGYQASPRIADVGSGVWLEGLPFHTFINQHSSAPDNTGESSFAVQHEAPFIANSRNDTGDFSQSQEIIPDQYPPSNGQNLYNVSALINTAQQSQESYARNNSHQSLPMHHLSGGGEQPAPEAGLHQQPWEMTSYNTSEASFERAANQSVYSLVEAQESITDADKSHTDNAAGSSDPDWEGKYLSSNTVTATAGGPNHIIPSAPEATVSLSVSGDTRKALLFELIAESREDLEVFRTTWRDPFGDLRSYILGQQPPSPTAQDIPPARRQWITEFRASIAQMVRITGGTHSFTMIVDLLFEMPQPDSEMRRPNPAAPLASPMTLCSTSSGRLGHTTGTPRITVTCPAGRVTEYLEQLERCNCCSSRDRAEPGDWPCLRNLFSPERPMSTFCNLNAFQKHTCIYDPMGLWYCESCGTLYSRRERLAEHLMRDHNVSRQDANQRSRERKVYDGRKRRECPWCRRVFIGWKEYYSHIFTLHAGDIRKAIEARKQNPHTHPNMSDLKRKRDDDDYDNDDVENKSNGNGSTKTGSSGDYVKVQNAGQSSGERNGHQTKHNKTNTGNQTRPQTWTSILGFFSRSLMPQLEKPKLAIDGRSGPDRIVTTSRMTASKDKLWCFVGATDPMVEGALGICRDAMDTGTALLSGLGAWIADSPECVDGDLDDDVRSLGQDCKRAVTGDLAKPREASSGNFKGCILRKTRTFPADTSLARCYDCGQLRCKRNTSLDNRYEMWGGELHTIGQVASGSWQSWGNKYEQAWESRLDYDAGKHKADQEREQMSLIDQTMAQMSLSTSSADTIESNATDETEYETDDDKPEIFHLVSQTTDLDLSSHTVEALDVDIDVAGDDVVDTQSEDTSMPTVGSQKYLSNTVAELGGEQSDTFVDPLHSGTSDSAKVSLSSNR